jgi:Streptomycin 6-kinase
MFTEMQIEKIIEAWGHDTYTKIVQEVDTYSEKWKLSDLRFHESYSMNAIFFCDSEIYGKCVLKISGDFQNEEFVWEYNLLREYNGHRYIKVYASDIDLTTGKKAMLLERIIPGTQLSDEVNLDRRLEVFSELYNGMHIAPANPSLYKRYADGLKDNGNLMSNREDCKDLYSHLSKAIDIYSSVAAVYNREMLLHGDLQYHNILLRENGEYAVIDPQGRIADPVFDIPRYILIEYYNTPVSERDEKINYIITYLEKSLNVPNEIIRQCFYIEMVSFECWWASIGDYTIDNVIFAEKIRTRLS